MYLPGPRARGVDLAVHMRAFVIRPGDTVLTLGTGSVSLFAIQLARLHGARVLVTSRSDERLARARALGADETINYLRHPAWHEAVLRRTDGRGVDHVVEVGGAGTFERSLAATRIGGHVAMVGLLYADGGGRSAALQILARAVRVTGVRVASRQALLALTRALARHAIQPVIDRVFPFEAAREAYHHLARGGHFGKVVIRC